MALERLEVQFEGPVARIWLNRPDVRNAFDGLMVNELRTTLFDLRTASGCVVVGRSTAPPPAPATAREALPSQMTR